MPLPHEFPQSELNSTVGPDFPKTSGDRERGKFRPSATPRLTQVAVAGDDGKPVTKTTDELLAELIMWQKVTVLALLYNIEGESFKLNTLFEEAQGL